MKTIETFNNSSSLFFDYQDQKMVEWFDNIVKKKRE